MNCDEFRSAVLAGEHSEAIDHHGETCAACRSRVAALTAARTSLADPAVWEEPSPELVYHVESLIRAAGRRAPGQTVSARLWMKLAAAAAIIAILAAGIFAVVAIRNAQPDWEVALPATDLGAGATATVSGWNEAAGTRMVLAVDGLSPAPDGFVYEFWLSNGPIHTSAGTFNSSGDIELWSGVKRADFPRLWVTLEPLDEDESPSKETVLDTGDV